MSAAKRKSAFSLRQVNHSQWQTCADRLKNATAVHGAMRESFTPDEELVMLFLKKHTRSTAAQIAQHTGLKQRGVLRRALDGLDAKGVLKHTDDADERYYLVHTG